MLNSFFSFLAKSRYLYNFLLSFIFILLSAEATKFTGEQVIFFLFIDIRSGLLLEIERLFNTYKF